MSDLLSAASLLLGALAILFGLWYPEITKAMDIVEPAHRADYTRPHRQIKAVLYSRAIPLTMACSLLTLVFAPDATRIIFLSMDKYLIEGIGALRSYSAVSTSFVLVVSLALTLDLYLIYFTIKLVQKVRKLAPNNTNR
jgi:hypothetical protein